MFGSDFLLQPRQVLSLLQGEFAHGLGVHDVATEVFLRVLLPLFQGAGFVHWFPFDFALSLEAIDEYFVVLGL